MVCSAAAGVKLSASLETPFLCYAVTLFCTPYSKRSGFSCDSGSCDVSRSSPGMVFGFHKSCNVEMEHKTIQVRRDVVSAK